MCRNLTIESLGLFDALETKLSMSAVAISPTAVTAAAGDDDLPLPDPEDDPGDLPTDDPPIIDPPMPPSGPVGPGCCGAGPRRTIGLPPADRRQSKKPSPRCVGTHPTEPTSNPDSLSLRLARPR